MGFRAASEKSCLAAIFSLFLSLSRERRRIDLRSKDKNGSYDTSRGAPRHKYPRRATPHVLFICFGEFHKHQHISSASLHYSAYKHVMSNKRDREKRAPRAQKPTTGKRKVAKNKKDQNDLPSPPVSPPRPCPRPKPVAKQPSVSQSDKDAAELLMGLGTRPRNPLNTVIDGIMGLTPEESAQLDADELREELDALKG